MSPRKKQRETYGRGSVTPKKCSDGSQRRDRNGRLGWLVRIDLGFDNSGKRLRPSRVFYGTLEEAREFASRWASEYREVEPDARDFGFGDLVNLWEQSVTNGGRCAEKQVKNYIMRLRRVEKELPSGKKLAEVKAHDIEKALGAVIEKFGYSEKTAKYLFDLVKRVFRYAEDNDWIEKSPMRKLPAPIVQETTSRRALSLQEFKALHRRIKQDMEDASASVYDAQDSELLERVLRRMGALASLLVILATGMRRGEVMALAWENVDFAGCSISVEHSQDHAGRIKRPKSKSGLRVLSIDEGTKDALLAWKELQAELIELLHADDETKIHQEDSTPVHCDADCSWVSVSCMTHWWEKYRVGIGLDGWKLHELRHTHATLLQAGVEGNAPIPIRDLQYRMGHSTPTLTLSIYTHPIRENDKRAAQVLGSLCA